MNYIKLDELVWFQEGPGVRNYQYTSAGVKLINVTNLVSKYLDLSLTDRYISEEEAYGKYKHFLCEDGDLVIASSGITYNSIPKKVSFVRKCDLPLCMNTSVIRFKTLDNKPIHIKYLYYFFKSNAYRNQISKLMTGSAQLNYGPAHLHKVVINKTTSEEQEHCICILDKITNTMELCENQLTLLDEVVKSRFNEMFGSCPKINLCGVSKIIMGQSPDSKSYNDEGKGIPFFQGKGDYGDKYTIVNHWTTEPKKVVEEGVVLMSVRAPVGPVNIANVRCCIGRGLCGINAIKGKTNNEFLYNALKVLEDDISSMGNGSTFKAINKDDVYNIKIPDASIERQNEFSVFSQLIDKSKFILKKQKKTLEELYESKLHEYFGD